MDPIFSDAVNEAGSVAGMVNDIASTPDSGAIAVVPGTNGTNGSGVVQLAGIGTVPDDKGTYGGNAMFENWVFRPAGKLKFGNVDGIVIVECALARAAKSAGLN